LEWIKFDAGSTRAVYEEYQRCRDTRHTRLHLDHIPVIDEDGERPDYLEIIREAIEIGYQSVMVDGSRLPFEENVTATKAVVDIAHAKGIPAEAELGAVLGHEAGPLPPYEELFSSGKGFTDVDDARVFVDRTDVDWLSISFGNIHGAISLAARGKKKPAARLDIDHLKRITDVTGRPIVLHGGSGIPREYIDRAIARGVAKINIGSDIRRAYETAVDSGEDAALAVFEATSAVIDRLGIRGTAGVVNDALSKDGSG
jgi:fructose/tagatose bisphosphate aldolase